VTREQPAAPFLVIHIQPSIHPSAFIIQHCVYRPPRPRGTALPVDWLPPPLRD
jgi:hypothetical protein